ncbi:MAG: diadenosine tetraphosphate hydrolase [Patescibacteria group bacterium]
MDKKLFPNDAIIVTENFDVHQDWETPIPGFLILACRRKIRSIMEFNQEEIQEFGPLLMKVRQALKDVLAIDTVYLYQAEDTTHEQFHLWILPRYSWMEKFGTRIQSVRPIIEHAKERFGDERNIVAVKETARTLRESIEK